MASSSEHQLTWRVTRHTARRFNELMDQLESTEEWSDHYYELLDEIKSLPHFPHGYDWENTCITVVVVDEPRVGYTGH